jgi:squalene-hopene/tetraprenyl-beta-curcumene cyclase
MMAPLDTLAEHTTSAMSMPQGAAAVALARAGFAQSARAIAGRDLDQTIEDASGWLLRRQEGDGHWVFPLEADASMPSEYVLLKHFLGEPTNGQDAKIATYLRRRQGAHGGWAMFHGGGFDLSLTVKAYFALKVIGDDPEAPHMRRARAAVLAHGGAAGANVFTRYLLALFGEIPWRGVPWMPIEAVLLPRWAPFHTEKVSYWSRTVMVPLLLCAGLRPTSRATRSVGVRELFVDDPETHRRYQTNPTGSLIGQGLLVVDAVGRLVEPVVPRPLQRAAVDRAFAFIRERLNGEDGLGGIFPAMMYSLIVLDAVGYPVDHPDRAAARRACDKLLTFDGDEGYCQPCVSPVWDTALALHALMEAGIAPDAAAVTAACDWLCERQVLTVAGDWRANRSRVRPGGWAFQYRNDHYPDVDDTAVVVMALHRADAERHRAAIARGAEWIIGMQSENGGWGAFDADNQHEFLNHIPFADHGALLDPPTADVTARCLGMLGQLGYDRDHPVVARAIDFLKREQEPDGSWFGRWGTNYVYGTWSVLAALNAIGEDPEQPYIRRAVDWLKAFQREDGGWGEDCATYWPEHRGEARASTASQTAWALLGLMAAGEVDSDTVRRGIAHLLAAPRDGGKWEEVYYNAVGFPRVFYLLYHGYSAYFPLWALSRYRNLRKSNLKRPTHGL